MSRMNWGRNLEWQKMNEPSRAPDDGQQRTGNSAAAH